MCCLPEVRLSKPDSLTDFPDWRFVRLESLTYALSLPFWGWRGRTVFTSQRSETVCPQA